MVARRVGEIDWTTWRAADRATLTFVVAGSRMLLIRKKRGLGAGKINAPGGRLDPGESWQTAAVREMEEELRVTPLDPVQVGENRFQFLDGYSIHVAIFRATVILGEPTETDEATPYWFDLAALPYGEMWEDDRLWVPHVIANRPFSGRFVFDGDVMLDHAIELL
ncbi:MAG TPA: 8-oxo-dGTP diphosphatase [Candidatus Limnocylindria bacterium]|nr:8-oxo-dGTP diphosphatase [Candidatus Limnocylindria bacterium]